MLLLVVFAVVAGAGTALTPCVLPVLPALLSASATGGRRRPLGIVLGLVVTHTVGIVALATIIDGVGLADGAARTLAVAVLVGFGLALLWPALLARIEAPLSRLARLGPKDSGDGFWSGLAVGGALGFVYAPCAGPILAAVVSVGATQGASFELVLVALGYGLGSGAMLLVLAYGGRRLVDRIRGAGRGPALQRVLGVVLVLTGVAMATELDVRFQTALAGEFPSFVTNPTRALERSDAVEDRLADLRGGAKFETAQAKPKLASSARASRLPVLGTAPEFTGNDRWFNSRPLTVKGLRGRVVLIDFWTYTCINCVRTFPALRALDRRYRDRGLTIVGVHTPEFAFERRADNVKRAIEQNDLRYPVAQDNGFATWEAWGNNSWPAKYLIDTRGRVRYVHIGEGDYEETDGAVRSLLAEAGETALGRTATASVDVADPGVQTPETYLGSERAAAFLPEPPAPGTRTYVGFPAAELPPSHFSLKGAWSVTGESSTAITNAQLDARFVSKKVFLVMSSRDRRPRRVRVLLDGKPIAAAAAGEDVKNGVVTVTGESLYRLVKLPGVEDRRLTLRFEDGVAGYAFTFG